MKKLKAFLFSPRGMDLVNLFFLLSLLLQNSLFSYLSLVLWILYLSWCIRVSESKGQKLVFKMFLALAAFLLISSLLFRLSGRAPISISFGNK